MFDTISNVGLAVIRKITDLWSAARSDSLIDYTKPTRVEPITVIDADCVNSPHVGEVLQSLLSTFAGYYLQAFQISLNVGKVEVMRHLDRLNPDRTPSRSAADAAGWLLSQESYKFRLPTSSNRPAMEAEIERSEATLGRDTLTTVRDLANLSVGKMLSVQISDGGHTATIPVSVRLMATTVPTNDLVNILSYSNKDRSVKERYHAWREGRLEFVKDLICCRDLIDAHFSNLIKDKTGIYSQIMDRRRNNKLSAMLSGNPTVAQASTLMVCSTETLERLEGETGMSFKDFHSRQKFFDNTYLMIVAVIDKNWERVTFYYHKIPHATECRVADLKASNKGSGPDVAEILKAYRMGSAPVL